jgi:tRNA dimethylallyltransferase
MFSLFVMPPHLLFIIGPTAVGKTAHVLIEATRLGAAVLYCDSVCFYRGMDIGSAKPTAEEQLHVPHYGIDLVDVAKPFTIADYMRYAQSTIAKVVDEGRPLIITGGSGFYLKSFFLPVIDEWAPTEAVKLQVEALEREGGLAGLVERLQQVSPDCFGLVDLKNSRRVVKALERCLLSGLTVSELRARWERQPVPFADLSKKVVLLNRPQSELHARIALRVDKMICDGLIEEVRMLRDNGLCSNPSAAASIGYRETLEWLDQPHCSIETLKEQICLHTRQLVKKQMTWFRHHIPVDTVLNLTEA